MKIGLIEVCLQMNPDHRNRDEKLKKIGCEKKLYITLSNGKVDPHEIIQLVEMEMIRPGDVLIVSSFSIISHFNRLLEYLQLYGIYIQSVNNDFDLYHPQDSSLFFNHFSDKGF
ncbi:hypothetical protein [Chryseobacterium sp.]|uniref:hypothetical protein n=1 Tax=Chryseobacterium sp. TaxID=1871047 RepID=UPI0025BBE886|nr:hypothetical protein [Chryseobacterium sp.]MBV8325002.1 hypothetical protein [Chryseobacterium sp.]